MVKSNQMSPGMTLTIGKKLYRVDSCVKVTVAKGNSFMKTKLRDLATGKVSEKNFKLDQDVKEINLNERKLEFLYSEESDYVFLDFDELAQVSVGSAVVGDRSQFLKEGVHVVASFFEDKVFAIELPQFLELMIAKVEDPKEKRGNTNKIGTLETGAEVEVPAFIDAGDIVKVDTWTHEFVQRV